VSVNGGKHVRSHHDLAVNPVGRLTTAQEWLEENEIQNYMEENKIQTK